MTPKKSTTPLLVLVDRVGRNAGREALALIADVRDPRPDAAVHQLWRWLVQRGAAA